MDKYIVIILDGEILSVQLSDGVTNINSQQSQIYIDTKDNLSQILSTLGIEDISKLEDFDRENIQRKSQDILGITNT